MSAPPSGNRNAIFLRRGAVTVGVDLGMGGAVFWLSGKDNANVVNTWDKGRLIQQSWYGEKDGSSWNGKPWCWNPVQGGDWTGKVSGRVDGISLTDAGSGVEVRSTPVNWGDGRMVSEAPMVTRVRILADGAVEISASMTYSGSANHPVKHQEAPACFFDARYSHLRFRRLGAPAGSFVQFVPDGTEGDNVVRDADPTWAMYVDPLTSKGIAVECPSAALVTAYRVDVKKNPPASNCSYVAPLLRSAVKGTMSYVTRIRLHESVT